MSTPQPAVQAPSFISEIQENYRSRIAHSFIIHDNVNDYSDDTGARGQLANALAQSFDVFCQNEQLQQQSAEVKPIVDKNTKPRVLAFFTFTGGVQSSDDENSLTVLQFAHDQGRKMWESIMTDFYKDNFTSDPLLRNPRSLSQTLETLNLYFQASKSILEHNQRVRKLKPTGLTVNKERPEINFTIVFMNSDLVFPNVPASQLSPDQLMAVSHFREWSKDPGIGPRNKIIAVANHLDDIQETLRSGDSGVKAIRIPRPDVKSRLTWLQSYNSMLGERTKAGRAVTMGGNIYEQIPLVENFTLEQFSNIAAGMTRKQMEAPIFASMMSGTKITKSILRQFKEDFITQESGGLIEFVQPSFGFEQIGGHEHIKRYMQELVIDPFESGDLDEMSRGILLTGPPGTGKTITAQALAKEMGGINCIIGHMDKMYDSLVGGSEAKMRHFLDQVYASAPVVLILDEFDSTYSNGRQSGGDSGTQARQFNMMMQFLSDSRRTGRVFVIALTNRPDLLDSALIRNGRFDARIPALPPREGNATGRMAIVAALKTKLDITLGKDLGNTLSTPEAGIGRLLHDQSVWTGAEIETVMKKARTKARVNGHKAIMLADWNIAMDSIRPNTGEVQQQIDLALYFVNDLEYVPDEWRDRIKSKEEMKSTLKTSYGLSLEDDDRE